MGSEPLRPGDPVTLLLPDHVVMVEVHTSSRKDFTVQLSSRGEKTYTSRWGLDEEGIGWLRGYHTADSREVDAARAAKGLEPQEIGPIGVTGVQGPAGRPRNPSGIPTYMPGLGPINSGSGGAVSREEVKSLMQQLLEEQAETAALSDDSDIEWEP